MVLIVAGWESRESRTQRGDMTMVFPLPNTLPNTIINAMKDLSTTPPAPFPPTPAPTPISSQVTKSTSTATKTTELTDDATVPSLSPAILSALEQLNIYQSIPNAPPRYIYSYHLNRAANTRLPSVLTIGRDTYHLTDHQIAAVFGWTTGEYRWVNPAARGTKGVISFDAYPFLSDGDMTKHTARLDSKQILPYVHVLQSALLRLPPLGGSVILYRGHRRPLPNATTFTLRGFTSVSRDRENALEFAESKDGRSSERCLLVILRSSSARSLTALSARREESELLFPLDTTFRRVEVKGDNAVPIGNIESDRRAVEQATERLRAKLGKDSNAVIRLVYVEEVVTGDWA